MQPEAFGSRCARRSPRFAGAVLLAWTLLAALVGAQDTPNPEKGLKSKQIAERLAAIESLRIHPDPKHEKLLLGLLTDRDLEVVEKAALALADRGGDASVTQLVKLAVEGPILRVRRAAARTLAKIGPNDGSTELVRLTSGKHAVRALEALTIVGLPSTEPAAGQAILKALKSKDAAVRRAAAPGIDCLPPAAGDDALVLALRGADAQLSAAMLDAVAAGARAHYVPHLLAAIREPQVPDVLERRLLKAAVACMATLEKLGRPEQPANQWRAFQDLGPPVGPEAQARVARLRAALDLGAAAEGELAKSLAPGMLADLAHAQPSVRKAAIHAVLRRGMDGGREAVVALATKDPDVGVRAIALRELADRHGAGDPEVLARLTESVSSDPDPAVREQAAVSLGVAEVPGAAAALVPVLKDPSWAVATCAAVSLGKTRDPAGLEGLVAMQSHSDWRYRASAAVGLCWLSLKEALPALILALGDEDPSVRRVAHVFLEERLRVKLPEERAPWEAWWKENEQRVRLVDPAEEKRRRERYGYAPKPEGVFEDLDVVVLESRGDHIEALLAHLKIEHRKTQASKLPQAALHPAAIYVSNCTGEIEAADVERLAWYVRAGGFLFGSCWSLGETIERIHPGVLRRLGTTGEVMDDVIACPVDLESPYLKNVFGPDIEPLYHLEGSHLIEVLDPERCQVLIDSPQALERWGGGNLAATFRAGHGLILDSANHFALQGLEVAPGVKTAQDRVAFAFDRMGLDFETWRRTQNEKWWDSALKASQNVFDLSALQFVTNFVRAKRLSDG